MKKLSVALLCVLLLSGCAAMHPNSSWTKKDTQLETTYGVLHTLDWRTTMDIAKHPGYFEMNPILGKHPTNMQIHKYFTVTGIMQYTIAKSLPPKQRTVWQVLGIIIEFAAVVNNFGLGLALMP